MSRPHGQRPRTHGPPQQRASEVPMLTILDPKPKNNDFLCKLKFRNEIPEIPCEPRFLQYPMDSSRFTRYVTTTLEKQQVFALHTEPDLGVPINLIEPDAYDIDQPMDLPPEDEALLLDDDLVTTKLKRKPEIADFKGATVDVTGRKQKRTKYNQEVAELSTEALLAEIEKSFEIGSSAPVHPVQPDLEPVEVLPILPDFELESNEYVHFVLDEDPTSGQQKLVASLGDVSSRAVMRSCQITRGVDGVHYYLPKTKLDAEQDEEQFTLVRDYVYAGKPDHRPGVLFLRHAEAAACINYNPLLARTHLRRVAKAPDSEVLIVNYSGLTEKDLQEREDNMNRLRGGEVEKEEEEKEEEEKEEDEKAEDGEAAVEEKEAAVEGEGAAVEEEG